MAIASPLNLIAIRQGVRGLGVAVTRAQVSANRSAGILLNRTKIKSKLVFGDRRLFQNRRDSVRRKRQESIVEASSIGGAIRSGATSIANTAKGFLGRIMDFLGTLLLGWMLNNLPTIISMAQELMGRIQRLVSILGSFVTNIGRSLLSFGKVLGAIGQNIASFDFFDTSNRVENAMSELNSVFDDMGKEIDEGMKLLGTPLTEGLVTGEDAAPFGTDYTTQPGSEGTPGQGGKLQPIHRQALDIIAGPESGGNYNAMNRGGAGDSPGGSKKWIGKNLTDMTIGEVLSLQSQGKLHAAGKYQFVPIQLPVSMKYVGLTPKDKFDKNNQDLMAAGLMKDRGLQPWTVGGSKYSDKERQIVEQARKTPFGAGTPTPAQVTPSPGRGVTTTVRDEINVSGPTGGTPTVGLTPGQGFGAARRGGRIHEGIDIGTSGQRGYYVALRKTGKVVFSGVAGGYGITVDIIGPDGTCYRFAHLAKSLVRAGQPYNGQTIGEIGNTGSGSGIHLHFEVRPGGPYGRAIDPRPYLGLLSIGRQLTGVAGQPAQVTAPGPTPAQVATRPTQRQQLPGQLTPERRGAQVVVIDDTPPPSIPQIPSAPSSGMMLPIRTGDSLNSFIKNKLLLDLAYT
jgi:murein DD-endopeptidase MepM/ murein hydrolase activator NlpD